MSSTGLDPLDQLRAADPMRPEDVPAASLARVAARTQEHLMADNVRTPSNNPMRRILAPLAGVAAVGALAFALAVGTGFGIPAVDPSTDPSTDPGNGAAGGGGMASCLAYDTAQLPTFDVVFDGTVTAVDGDQVSFDVNDDLKGAGDSITLTAPDVDVALLGGLPDFQVGGRYLVTATSGSINACGYTIDYDAGEAADWAAAF